MLLRCFLASRTRTCAAAVPPTESAATEGDAGNNPRTMTAQAINTHLRTALP